jgi:uncharacterized membrane protein YedE/YeeE
MKVLGFLDVTGSWDPTLAFVMLGALLAATPAVRLILRRSHPILADNFALPTKTTVDARLLGGATLFGIGWGACAGVRVRRGDARRNGSISANFREADRRRCRER